MEYDEKFLLKAADRFEQQARAIVYQVATRYTFFGFVGSFLGAAVLDYIVRRNGMPEATVPVGAIVLIATATSLAIGIFVGREQAFKLRVEAHKLLALVEIHHNTCDVVTLTDQSVAFVTDPKMLSKPHA